MLYAVFLFSAFGIVPAVDCAYEIACDSPDSFEAYVFAHKHVCVFAVHWVSPVSLKLLNLWGTRCFYSGSLAVFLSVEIIPFFVCGVKSSETLGAAFFRRLCHILV